MQIFQYLPIFANVTQMEKAGCHKAKNLKNTQEHNIYYFKKSTLLN